MSSMSSQSQSRQLTVRNQDMFRTPLDPQYRFGDMTRYLFNTTIRSVYGFLSGQHAPELSPEEAEYRRNITRFRAALQLTFQAGNISEEQIRILWKTAKHIKAEDAAPIMIELIQGREAADVEKDDAQALEDFSMIVDILLAGNIVNAGQLEPLKKAAKKLKRITIITIVSEKLKRAYENTIKAKFEDAVVAVTNSSSITPRDVALLRRAAELLADSEVTDVFTRYNTSWEKIESKEKTSKEIKTDGSIPQEVPQQQQQNHEVVRAKPPQPPPPPPRKPAVPPPPPPVAAAAPLDEQKGEESKIPERRSSLQPDILGQISNGGFKLNKVETSSKPKVQKQMSQLEEKMISLRKFISDDEGDTEDSDTDDIDFDD